jgi:CBS domain-containing protein
MLRLQDIMTRNLVTLSPEHSLGDAMSLLASRHISGAPVLTNGKLVGVISLTDLVEFTVAMPGVPTERPESVESGEWDEALDLLEGEEPPARFFTQLWDDAGADVTDRMEESGGPEWNVLHQHTVGEAMTRNVLTLAPTVPVEFAARFMRGASIHRVLVVERGDLVGIVTTKDISDAVAARKFVHRRYVFDTSSRMRS